MKTTVEIDDALLKRAKQLALERNVSLKALLETALRQFVEQAQTQPHPPFKLRKCPMYGRGLQPELDEKDWSTIRAMAYGDRGD